MSQTRRPWWWPENAKHPADEPDECLECGRSIPKDRDARAIYCSQQCQTRRNNRRWKQGGYIEMVATNRRLIEEAKAVSCLDCGGMFPKVCMDFDHRDPTQKKFNIGRAITTHTPAALVAEIAKCDVVCANCHRIRTHMASSTLEGATR